MDPGFERVRRIQEVGRRLAYAYRERGHPSWHRVALCNSGIICGPGGWQPANRACRDRFCPRCSYAAMLRYAACLQKYNAGDLYFCTYTWREGLEVFDAETCVEVMKERALAVRYFSGHDLVWKSEFTLRENGLLHHHIHSIQRDLKRTAGFRAPWQNCDVQEYDGNLAEILKYMANEDSFDYVAAVSQGLFRTKVRLRGKRGFPLEATEYREWPIIVQRGQLQGIVVNKEESWQEGEVSAAAAVSDVVGTEWVESFFGLPASE